jgi:hypothetical protein
MDAYGRDGSIDVDPIDQLARCYSMQAVRLLETFERGND